MSERLQDIISLVADLQYFYQLLIVGFYVLVCVLVYRPVARLVARLFIWLISSSNNTINLPQQTLQQISPSLRLVVLFSLFLPLLELPLLQRGVYHQRDISQWLYLICYTGIIVGGTKFIYVCVQYVEYIGGIKQRQEYKTILHWLITFMRLIVVLLVIVYILAMWGLDIIPLLTSMGIVGVAVALGAQDIFKNMLGGITIMIEQRFSVGDWIETGNGITGTVEKIGLRSTTLRQFNKTAVHINNSTLTESSLINWTKCPYRPIHWRINLEYRTTQTQLQNICARLKACLEEDPDFITDGSQLFEVRLVEFSDSSIDFAIYCVTNTNQWLPWLAIRERLLFIVKDVVESNGASFAFPSQSVYFADKPFDSIIK